MLTRNPKKHFKRRSFIKGSFKFVASIGVSTGVNSCKSTKGGDAQLKSGLPSQNENELSNQHTQLLDSYDMVIVGSGYGSSVIGARLAKIAKENNKTLCIIERGKEFFPGDFPKETIDVLTEARRSLLNPLGLLDININLSSDLGIVQASGLGGTSLINAAISIKPEKLVFEQKEWPQEIKNEASSSNNNLGKLEKYYKLANDTLRSTSNEPVMKNLGKSKVLLDAFQKSTDNLSDEEKLNREKYVDFGYLNLNINYFSTTNEFNIKRPACTLCGDCCAGCNVGAKNILPTNYLAIAKSYGAHIFTGITVDSFTQSDDGYKIKTHQTLADESFHKKSITTKNLVIGAGSMGSTKLLLNSQKNGPIESILASSPMKFSKKLGKNLSLNGDVLGICYNGSKRTNQVGFGLIKTSERNHLEYVGPCISTYGNYRTRPKDDSIQSRFLLLDGSIPSALAVKTAQLLAMSVKNHPNEEPYKSFTEEQKRRIELDLELTSESKQVNPEGALNHSLLMLACSHDNALGEYSLKTFGGLKVIWNDVKNQDFFRYITDEMKYQTNNMGGTFIPNPITKFFNDKLIATHPLGGCVMGDNISNGVVDHKGRVFKDGAEGEIYKGLYVVDGAIIPRSLGAPPLLTITAIAERIAEHMIRDKILG